ncbi:MAG: extracellular solute-binding protein [Planctomycetota bacterium]
MPAALAVLTALLLWPLACAGCEEDSGDVRRLEFWTLALKPHFDDYIEERIAAFEAEHPGVEVEWVDVSFDAVDRKLIASAAANRAPDVINLSDRSFARFASLGAMEDLNGLLPGDPGVRYLSGVLDIGRVGMGDGGPALRALPWYLTTQATLVNAEQLENAGLRPERVARDWAGLRAQARAYHERTGRFLFSVPLGQESELPWMMLADGIVPFEVENGRLVSRLNSPDVRGFIAEWVSLYEDGVLPREAATTGHSHLIELYQSGSLGLIVTGPNFLNRIRDVAPSVFEVTEVRPGITGTLGRQHVAVMVLGVTTQSRDPELAAKLAWFMTGPESQNAFCRLATILPSTSESLDDPFFSPDPTDVDDLGEAKLLTARGLSASALRTAVAFTPALETWPDLRRAFEDGIKRTLLEGRPLDETLAAIDREWSRILASAPPAGWDAVPRPGPAIAVTSSN